MLLPRQPGARESRWAHLLSGAPSIEEPEMRVEETASLKSRVERLEVEVAELRELIKRQ